MAVVAAATGGGVEAGPVLAATDTKDLFVSGIRERSEELAAQLYPLAVGRFTFSIPLGLTRLNMIYFAQLDESSSVKNVIVLDDEHHANAEEFLINSLKLDGPFVETWVDGGPRKNFASIGFTYDKSRDAFIPKKPRDYMVFNEETCNWELPEKHPNDGKRYYWSDSDVRWVEAPENFYSVY